VKKQMNKSPSKAQASVAGRQRIVSAARAHFFIHGFRRVTTDDLADQLGISKKTLLPATLD
jgi:AcrR family transcriptional regulator